MRSIWRGAINFGLVSIPSKLYTATDDKRISFHQIHAGCGSRIQMPKWCPRCERKVEAFEISKGYEVSKDNHIILEESDLTSLPLKSVKTIEVVEFIEPTQIDVRAFADCYFLAPQDEGSFSYGLLLTVMEKTNLVAIGKLCYREREHLSSIRPYNGIMLLQTLHYADELRAYDELKPKAIAIGEKELSLALTLVNALKADSFDLSKYEDDYREALERLIEAKLSGRTIAVEEKPVPVSSVADALIQSLQLVKAKS